MIHSLRFRLIAVTTILPIVTMAAVGLLIRDANASTFDRGGNFTAVGPTGERISAIKQARIEDSETSPSGKPREWYGEQTVSEPGPGQGICSGSFQASIESLPVDVRRFDAAEGAVIYSSSGQDKFAIAAAPQFIKAFENDEKESLYDLNLTVFAVIGSAGLLCGVVGFIASQRIIGPVAALTQAAQKLENGDLEQRVGYEGRDEVGRLSHAFNSMAERLDRNQALRKTMTSDIAHELRTPLNNIAGFIDMLSDGLVEPDERVLSTLQEETQLLVRLVDELEQLSLGDSGQLRLDLQETALEAPVERALQAMRPTAQTRGVELVFARDEPVPAVMLDSSRFDQVLRNLLENAIRHTPENGTVTVGLREQGGGALLTVADTGEGIPPEHLPNIFERFYRADSSRTRGTGGSGLGLAITKQIVEAHGGAIEASNVPGGGAVFTVRLPAAGLKWQSSP